GVPMLSSASLESTRTLDAHMLSGEYPQGMAPHGLHVCFTVHSPQADAVSVTQWLPALFRRWRCSLAAGHPENIGETVIVQTARQDEQEVGKPVEINDNF